MPGGALFRAIFLSIVCQNDLLASPHNDLGEPPYALVGDIMAGYSGLWLWSLVTAGLSALVI
jgi:hypothetical protein